MKHVKALLIKFVGSLILLYLILGLIYGMDFGEVFLLSLVLGVAAYVIGDLLILPRTNNTIATIADFGLAWAIIYWFTDTMTPADNPIIASLIAAIAVGIFEAFFHSYLANHVLPNEDKGTVEKPRNYQYQTEFSEELTEEDDHKFWD
ncbi:YndM family protein [Ornithinibacillus sp. 179-J 7C1 HS]|uniref:YndM family protein n=1 Tax=Ornithinibacillus sp. 179-J 7C1 HS TaxID=3142384 RepID=UPI0039A3533E